MTQPKTRAVVYIRVSTDKQADSGLGLDAQRDQCAAYAALYGLEVAEVVQDAASAKTLERPGLTRALGMLKRCEASAILVAKLDRLTRRVGDLADLVETWFAGERYALLSVGEQLDTRTAAGRLMMNILASVGQWEREAIGERTKAAMAELRKQGRQAGTVPWGYRAVNGLLEAEPGERETLRLAQGLRAEGMPLRKIACELAAMGRVGRSGRPLSHVQVDRLTRRLSNPDA